MCRHGQQRNCRVWLSPALSHTGRGRWAIKPIDLCLADRVDALNAAGRFTRSCCCGHGKGPGDISLYGGVRIKILVCGVED